MEALARLDPDVQAKWLAEQPEWALADMAKGEWWWTGRPEQQAPPGPWFVWLLLAGRGFGKTRTCAEWLVNRMLKYPVDTAGFRTEWLLIAETMADAIAQCVNGPAGIRRVLERRIGPECRRRIKDGTGAWKLWKGVKSFIELETGQVIYIEGADDEDVGRGYNASGAWLDEYAKWNKPDGSWLEGIMPSLRADLPGDFPRAIVATTPKLVAQLIDWQDRAVAGDPGVALTTGSTYDNAANLAAPMLAEFHRNYHGTRLGRQELYGELIREIMGALWSYDWIERFRVRSTPPMVQTVVAIDPAGSGTRDETGLIAAGKDAHGTKYVLGDWSKKVAGYPAARRAWEMVAKFNAGWLLVETNIGKRWLTDVLRRAYRDMQDEGVFPPGGSAPIKTITAKINKQLRAEPVSAMYEQCTGQVRHADVFGDLETQMISWVPGETKDSPDRVDALVYDLLWLDGRLPGQIADTSKRTLPRTAMSPLAYGPGVGMAAGPYD